MKAHHLPLVAFLGAGTARAQDSEDVEPTQQTSEEPDAPPVGDAPAQDALQPLTEQTREFWNAQGNLVRRIKLVGGELAVETTYTYDEAGGLVEEKQTAADGTVTLHSWTWDEAGNPTQHTVAVDGETTLTETFVWEGDMKVKQIVADPLGVERTTTFTYNDEGNLVVSETVDADGNVVARTEADREAIELEPIPVTFSLTGGYSTLSDVRSTTATAAFSIERKPEPSRYDTDPFEVGLSASYNRGTSNEELTNDQLKAATGVDYNHMVGRLTTFLFTTFERNPVANLDIDLYAAPLGAKYDFVPEGTVTFDASFAPVWNYRSIAVAAGEECDGQVLSEDGHCTFSKIRGSLRLRASLTVGTLKIKDTVEFLPTISPVDDFVQAIEDEAIVRNTLSASIALGEHLSVGHTLAVARDPLLAEQADCEADPDNLLCDGLSVTTGTTLTVAYSF